MKRTIATLAVMIAPLNAPLTASAEEETALVQFRSLKPEVALDLAMATLEACRAEGYQVAVVVVDRAGLEQVVLRDRYAGPHTVSTATRKAWTSVSFRAGTLELAELTGSDPKFGGLREVTGALFLGGGLPVEAAGTIVGGIGVSGAPAPDLDEACAEAGLDAISDRLDF